MGHAARREATTAAPESFSAGRQRLIFATVSIGVLMATLDLTVVNVALPTVSAEFNGAPLAEVSWILNGYAIVYAALLVPAGRLADRSGRRRGFLAGVALFTAASVLCAAAPNLAVLVAARALQAVGAAALVPTSLGILLAVYPQTARGRVVRAWTAVGALARAFGPLVGGVLVSGDWQWVFWVNVPIGGPVL